MKVFLVMGINWLFEFLSFLAGWQWDKDIAKNLSYFSDMVNLLQGVNFTNIFMNRFFCSKEFCAAFLCVL